jgi:L-ornithine N5-oxygenase
MDAGDPYRIAVVGGGQSAAEMLWAAHQRFGQASLTMLMRSIGLASYSTSRFTNELYFPSFVDEYFAAPLAVREHVLAQMHATNYSGLDPRLLDTLYEQAYIERVTGRERISMLTNTDVAAAEMEGDELVLTLSDRMTGRAREVRYDRVLLGTGFSAQPPAMIADLVTKLGIDEAAVDRNYRLVLPAGDAACYLQGVNETTHGIADSLLSVAAVRAGEIVADIMARRAGRAGHPGRIAAAAGELGSALCG